MVSEGLVSEREALCSGVLDELRDSGEFGNFGFAAFAGNDEGLELER